MLANFEPIRRLHHFAWRCKDAEETRAFYEDILGLPLVHVVRADSVPSTGENFPYVHLFFALRDGSSVAFFDLGDDIAALPSPNTPAWVNHLALKVDSLESLARAKKKLEAAGVNVLGITDHGPQRSIYFFDPNGIRLELTTDIEEFGFSEAAVAEAHAQLDEWTAEKSQSGIGASRSNRL